MVHNVDIMDSTLLTVKQVVLSLPLSPSQVYDLARQNIIPSIRIGGKVLFKKSDIELIKEYGTATLAKSVPVMIGDK